MATSPVIERDGEIGTDHGVLGPAVDFTLVVAGCLAADAPRMAIAERFVCTNLCTFRKRTPITLA